MSSGRGGYRSYCLRCRAARCGAVKTFRLDLAVRFYKMAKVLFAPQPELVEMLRERTGSRCI